MKEKLNNESEYLYILDQLIYIISKLSEIKNTEHALVKRASQVDTALCTIIEKIERLEDRTDRNEKDICAIGDALIDMNNQERKAINAGVDLAKVSEDKTVNTLIVPCPHCKGQGKIKMVHPE